MARGGVSADPKVLRWPILGLGILAVSTASVLIRLAQAPSLSIGAWRMTLATLMLTPWALPAARREWPALASRDWLRIALAGLALAIHFAAWISSLAYTTVASSVILVSTNPIFVALASRHLLRERIGRGTILGIALAIAGTALVSYGDLDVSGRALMGDALALLGAMAASAYILLGRAVRAKLSTWAYVWPCYGLAGLLLLAACASAGQPLGGYGGRTWLILALLAAGPQVLGHSSFNWALAHFSPIFVTLAILGEPIGATLLAFAMLGETPAWTTLLGTIPILAGIYVAARDEANSRSGDKR
jgi:drug/metabolite transporter (DMT)-like permease